MRTRNNLILIYLFNKSYFSQIHTDQILYLHGVFPYLLLICIHEYIHGYVLSLFINILM